ncbi:hypothetical protein D3C86_1366380 [compost metagenome]
MPFRFNEIRKGFMLCAQFGEYVGGDVVNQTVFKCSRRKTNFVAAQEPCLAKDIAFDKPVVKLAAASINLHCAAAHIVQILDNGTRFQDVATGLEVTHINSPSHSIYRLPGQLIKRGKTIEMVADFLHLGLHGTSVCWKEKIAKRRMLKVAVRPKSLSDTFYRITGLRQLKPSGRQRPWQNTASIRS